MATIKNINPAFGEQVTTSSKTLAGAITDMLQSIHWCGPEFQTIERLIEGEDYEVVDAEDSSTGLPADITRESAHYALDGPKEQRAARLREIISSLDGWFTDEAELLRNEAEDYLEAETL